LSLLSGAPPVAAAPAADTFANNSPATNSQPPCAGTVAQQHNTEVTMGKVVPLCQQAPPPAATTPTRAVTPLQGNVETSPTGRAAAMGQGQLPAALANGLAGDVGQVLNVPRDFPQATAQNPQQTSPLQGRVTEGPTATDQGPAPTRLVSPPPSFVSPSLPRPPTASAPPPPPGVGFAPPQTPHTAPLAPPVAPATHAIGADSNTYQNNSAYNGLPAATLVGCYNHHQIILNRTFGHSVDDPISGPLENPVYYTAATGVVKSATVFRVTGLWIGPDKVPNLKPFDLTTNGYAQPCK
jgi:hypothetical protein